jgi:hypothetical protein
MAKIPYLVNLFPPGHLFFPNKTKPYEEKISRIRRPLAYFLAAIVVPILPYLDTGGEG